MSTTYHFISECHYQYATVKKYDSFFVKNKKSLPYNWSALSGDDKYDYLNERGLWFEGWFDDTIDLIDDAERSNHYEVVVNVQQFKTY
jgi:hypothetical protein